MIPYVFELQAVLTLRCRPDSCCYVVHALGVTLGFLSVHEANA